MRLGQGGEGSALRRAVTAAVVAGALTFAAAPAANADDPVTVRARIAAATARVDTLAAKAAAASEAYNGADYALQLAARRVTAAKAAAQSAETDAEAARLVVERLSLGGVAAREPYQRLRSFFRDGGPSAILSELSAYDAVNDAGRAALAAYASKQSAAATKQRAAEVAVAKHERAAFDASQAKAAAQTAVTAASGARVQLQRERDQLIRDLADAEGISVTIARKRQRELEKLAAAAQEAANRPPGDLTELAPPTTPTVPSDPAPIDSTPPKRVKGVEAAIEFALKQVGEPYVWAGAGPDIWDCSGLTMRAWQAAGRSLPHFSGAQYATSIPISLSAAKRGDLLFWSRGGPSSIYHVALYLGDGWMVEAPRPGKNVQVVSVYASTMPDLAARIR